MISKDLVSSLMAVVTAVMAVIVIVSAPETPGPSFFVGVGALASAAVALLTTLRSLVGWERGSAGVWLRATPVPVAGVWALVAFAQTLGSSLWSWKTALIFEVLFGGATVFVSLVASSVARSSELSQDEDKLIQETQARIHAAARRVLLRSKGAPLQIRIECVATHLLDAPRTSYSDILEADQLESDLARLEKSLPEGSDVEVELRLEEVERDYARRCP